MFQVYFDPARQRRVTLRIRVQGTGIIRMPDPKDDNHAPLDQVRGNRGLARGSEFMARRARELAQNARVLNLADDIEVVFPDKILETAVREALEKPEGPLIRRDLKRLTQEDHGRFCRGVHGRNSLLLRLLDSEKLWSSPRRM